MRRLLKDQSGVSLIASIKKKAITWIYKVEFCNVIKRGLGIHDRNIY